jgi:hypothetical protein
MLARTAEGIGIGWARIENGRGEPGMTQMIGSVGAGRAGAATAGACGLCVAGSYQTGSGSSRRRRFEKCSLGGSSRLRRLRGSD